MVAILDYVVVSLCTHCKSIHEMRRSAAAETLPCQADIFLAEHSAGRGPDSSSLMSLYTHSTLSDVCWGHTCQADALLLGGLCHTQLQRSALSLPRPVVSLCQGQAGRPT